MSPTMASPSPVRRRGDAALDYLRPLIRRDAGTVVGDRERNIVLSSLDFDPHRHVVAGVFDRVAEQVREELFEPVAVGQGRHVRPVDRQRRVCGFKA